MRFFRFTLLPSGDFFSRFRLLMLVAGSLCICSCEDDMDRSSASAYISFTPEVSAAWNPATRSAGGTDTPHGTVTTLQDGSMPLYLHTLYTDSIASPSLDSRNDTSVLTRATPVTGTNMYESFGVSAYSYIGGWDGDKTPNYMYDVTASKSGSDYLLSSTYYWPGEAYKMKFFAYAPKGNSQYILSGSTYAGAPTISVSVPSDVSDQKDLLVAESTELNGNHNSTIDLTFYHALTAVKFVCGDDMQGGTVKSVSLKNVYSEGTYNIGTKAWGGLGTPATFSQTLNKETTGSPAEELTADAQTFMMIPQTLPDGAQIEVVFTDKSSTEHTLTADIKGTAWPMGKTVTYKISSSSINWTYTLTVNGPSDFEYTGGMQKYGVVSYKENTKGEKVPIGWTALYSTDNGTSWTNSRPDWITDFTASGDGSISEQLYNATVNAQTGSSTSSHTSALQEAPSKGSVSSPYNLANQTNGGATNENTANCYVVSAPGVYSFPLVYGNAIKNSTTNSSAYTSTVSGSSILNPFINHAGNGITNPYISRNANCTPTRAELVWQDALNLVTDIEYNNTGNGGNISFTVNKNTIQQGNAVIAIKDAGNNILWSWHIWVTDEDISNTIEVFTPRWESESHNLMSVNIGWCDANTIAYAERSCKVKYIAGKTSKIITIRQSSKSISVSGNNPFYQWGRKDPFLPANGLDRTNKIWYDKDGASSTANPATMSFSSGFESIKGYILYPNVMHASSSSASLYINLWSASNPHSEANPIQLIKTIYDPSPVGFQVPPLRAYSGFTRRWENTTDPNDINGYWDSSLSGYQFFTSPVKTNTIFFPASGYRRGTDGVTHWAGEQGWYWAASPFNDDKGWKMSFNEKDYVDTYGVSVRFRGLSVRTMRDE